MKIVLEPAPAPYDPALYCGSPSPTRPVDTRNSISDAEIALYREQGYLFVCNAVSETCVAEVRAELEAMALAADPGCESVGFEGLIRDHLSSMRAAIKSAPLGASRTLPSVKQQTGSRRLTPPSGRGLCASFRALSARIRRSPHSPICRNLLRWWSA